MPLTFAETPLYYKDSQGQYHRILSGADMTGYRTAAAQDVIDAARDNAPNIGMFEKFAVIGDSFASGYISVGGTAYQKYAESWGQILARKRGNRCVNYSVGGYRTDTFLDSNNSYYNSVGMGAVLADITANKKCGVYLICLGVNDANNDTSSANIGSSSDINQSDYTQNGNTFWGRYGRIIQQIKANYSNALFICCGFKRAPMSAQDEAYANYNTAIKNIATFFNLPYIDPTTDSFFTSSFYLDNMVSGHPTAPVYSAYADAMDRLISIAINSKLSQFKTYLGDNVNSDSGYIKGTSIIHSTEHNWAMLTGIILSGSKTLRFLIPLTAPVLTNKVTLTGRIILHSFDPVIGSLNVLLGDTTTTPNTYTYASTPYGLAVQVIFSSALVIGGDTVTNGSMIIVQLNTVDIAFE